MQRPKCKTPSSRQCPLDSKIHCRALAQRTAHSLLIGAAALRDRSSRGATNYFFGPCRFGLQDFLMRRQPILRCGTDQKMRRLKMVQATLSPLCEEIGIPRGSFPDSSNFQDLCGYYTAGRARFGTEIHYESSARRDSVLPGPGAGLKSAPGAGRLEHRGPAAAATLRRCPEIRTTRGRGRRREGRFRLRRVDRR